MASQAILNAIYGSCLLSITEKAQLLKGIWFEKMFHNSSKGLEGLIIVKASIELRLKGPESIVGD